MGQEARYQSFTSSEPITPTLVELGQECLLDIVDIERSSFSCPWAPPLIASELTSAISLRAGLAVDNLLVGYVFTHFVARELHILNLAIHPEFRGRGFGRGRGRTKPGQPVGQPGLLSPTNSLFSWNVSHKSLQNYAL